MRIMSESEMYLEREKLGSFWRGKKLLVAVWWGVCVVASAVLLLNAGCQTWPPWDWDDLPSVTNLPPVITNLPPVIDPPDPEPPVDAMTPIKIEHGAVVKATGHEGRDGSVVIDGVKFRVFAMKPDDVHYCKQAANAKAIRVQGGRMVAHDFVNNDGQVMVFRYWTLGTSSLDGKSTENPVARVAQDTRVWYTVHAPVGGTVTPPVTPDPPVTGCQNKPAFCKPSDVPQIPDVTANGKSAQGQWYGSIPVRNMAEATNLRFRLMSWFHNEGYGTTYPYPGKDSRGYIYVQIRDLPEDPNAEVNMDENADEPNVVQWRVLES